MGKDYSNYGEYDLIQSADLDVEIAQRARDLGNHEREAAAHEDLNKVIDEMQRRGMA